MVYEYVVTLRNDKGKLIDLISILIAAISVTAFIIWQIRGFGQSFLYIILCALIMIGLGWNVYQSRVQRERVYYRRVLAMVAVIWFVIPSFFWLGVLIMFLATLEKQAKLPLEIGFTHDRIVFNTFIRRKFRWQDFSNVMLKDGLLTLDFKSNRLFQRQIHDQQADEKEFNAYCRLRMAAV